MLKENHLTLDNSVHNVYHITRFALLTWRDKDG